MNGTADPIRVLHVDDEPSLAEVVAEFLELEDDRFRVRTASDPDAAETVLAEGGIDCIVSDYDMPDRDGIQFLRAVREEHPDLPFILYTGKGSEEVASDAISAGVTDYLQKGGGTDQYAVLANRIANAVDHHRSRQALAERNRELRQYERMVNSMRESACVYDEDGRFVIVNEYLADWYGTSRDELVGEASNLVPRVREGTDGDPYRELLDGEREEVRGEVAGEFPGHGHAVLEYRLTPLEVDGTVEGVVGVARDVTERKEREQELHRNQRAMEEAPVGITITDAEGDQPLTYANPGFLDLTGYAEDEVLGRNCRFLQGENTDPEQVAAIREAIDAEERVRVELRNYRKDGTEFWNEVSIAPVREGGSVANYVGFQRDVTERKERERDLERARDLLTHTERIADVGGWEIDPGTGDVFWTDHLFELLGVEYEEEPPLDEALDVYHEDDRAIVEEAVETAVESGDPFDVEVRFRRPDGEVRWLRVQGTPSVADGEVVTLRGAVQDVTDRRRREQVLRDVYEVVSDQEASFEDQVRALLELGRAELDTRYGTLSEIRGEDYVFEVVDAADDGVREGDVVPVSATNCEVAASTERTLVLGDVERDAPGETDRAGFTEWGISCYIGSPVFVDGEVYGTFCFYDTEARAGEFSAWEVTLVDLMSRWVGYELQRRRSNERLQEQNERLERFADIVGHDLRNPLEVANAGVELARAECDSDRLDDVEEAHARMESLIENLLELAREDGPPVEPERVDLREVVESAWASVETAGAGVDVDVDRPVRADESRLRQVFENLFRNAVEHGGEGATVTVGDLPDGFYVEDDGPGIPGDERAAVFEVGYSTDPDGTGFGLGIVRQVIEAHSWQVDLTEGQAGGARFEVTGLGSDR